VEYWVSLALLSVEDSLALAEHAERLGFAGVTMPDHVVMPEVITARYTGNASGTLLSPRDAYFPSCWVLIAAMAARTLRLKFATTVSVVAARNPLVQAKDIATVARIAPGRVVVGVGVGWMSDEFEILGENFADRGRRTDEIVELMRAAWRAGVVEHTGRSYTYPRLHMQPTPPGPVPIWIGGGSAAAFRRAARIGDGFVTEGYFDEVDTVLDRLAAARSEVGTLDRPFEVVVSTVGRSGGEWPTSAEIAHLEARGVTGIKIRPWSGPADRTTLSEKVDALERLGAELFQVP
jgi:probable F420-dependent oxidoreductase